MAFPGACLQQKIYTNRIEDVAQYALFFAT